MSTVMSKNAILRPHLRASVLGDAPRSSHFLSHQINGAMIAQRIAKARYGPASSVAVFLKTKLTIKNSPSSSISQKTRPQNIQAQIFIEMDRFNRHPLLITGNALFSPWNQTVSAPFARGIQAVLRLESVIGAILPPKGA